MLIDGGRVLTSEDASDDREHGFEQGQALPLLLLGYPGSPPIKLQLLL